MRIGKDIGFPVLIQFIRILRYTVAIRHKTVRPHAEKLFPEGKSRKQPGRSFPYEPSVASPFIIKQKILVIKGNPKPFLQKSVCIKINQNNRQHNSRSSHENTNQAQPASPFFPAFF